MRTHLSHRWHTCLPSNHLFCCIKINGRCVIGASFACHREKTYPPFRSPAFKSARLRAQKIRPDLLLIHILCVACMLPLVNFSFVRFDVDNIGMKKLNCLKRGRARTRRGPGEERARTRRGTGEDGGSGRVWEGEGGKRSCLESKPGKVKFTSCMFLSGRRLRKIAFAGLFASTKPRGLSRPQQTHQVAFTQVDGTNGGDKLLRRGIGVRVKGVAGSDAIVAL